MVKIFQFLQLSTKFLDVLRLSVNPIKTLMKIIIGLSKMQFPAFSGSELVNQDSILRH